MNGALKRVWNLAVLNIEVFCKNFHIKIWYEIYLRSA